MADPDPIAPLAFRAMDDQPSLQRFDELKRRQPLATLPLRDELQDNKEIEQINVLGPDAHSPSSGCRCSRVCRRRLIPGC
ncbi:hypothetical protein EMIT0111MI5_20460 [Burkholderia sp. IT-111MI5]